MPAFLHRYIHAYIHTSTLMGPYPFKYTYIHTYIHRWRKAGELTEYLGTITREIIAKRKIADDFTELDSTVKLVYVCMYVCMYVQYVCMYVYHPIKTLSVCMYVSYVSIDLSIPTTFILFFLFPIFGCCAHTYVHTYIHTYILRF